MTERAVADRTGRTGPTKAQLRRRGMTRLRRTRRLVQLVIAVLIVVAAVRHQTSDQAPSVDALCPFGAVETLVTWLTTGSYLPKIHESNLVLGLAVAAATLLAGNAFCGWVCPLGAVQDLLAWVARRLHIRQLVVPAKVDRVLRYGRFVVLGVIVLFSVTTTTLWFATYDPYVTLFGLHWLFEPDWSTLWAGVLVLAVVLAGSLFVERLWCRYLCPLGGVLSLVGRLGILRIRRSRSACTECAVCDHSCPVGIEPSKAQPFVSPDCIGCLDCVAACPVKNALHVEAPVLLGFPVRRELVGTAARRTGNDALRPEREAR
ncbi:MAG TPA: 4Fe-4S binding protein [Propionibacteriaceae bacterium]|nr:4Fe-4S binding protein [Propionibacteriaceae bacterium]